MADLTIDYKGMGPLDPKDFTTLNRQPGDLKWEESYQYDAHGRGKVVEHIKATAPGRLKSEVPEAGWVGPAGYPCREFTDGARPVWIWWAGKGE